MPHSCSRSVDDFERLGWSPGEREMPMKNERSPFHRKLLSPGPFEKRTVESRIEKPAAVPQTVFARDSRGSLEIFGTSAHKGPTPVFSSPAWHDALETAENLLQNSPCRSGSSLFGDEFETSSVEKGWSSLWKTKSRSQLPGIPKPPAARPRAFNSRGSISPVSITLEYGGSDEFSLEDDSDDVKSALRVSDLSLDRPQKVLTPNRAQPVVAVYKEPKDIEEQWRAILRGTASKATHEEDSVKNEEDEHWQGVLDGGVQGLVPKDYNGTVRTQRTSVGPSSVCSDDVRSERALQWGYEVPLRSSAEFGDGGSTLSGRTSTVSSQSRSSAGSNSSQTIPRVAKDVRDAITSFNLAFVVCDATGTDPTYPVLYASGGFFRMTGYEADEVIGSNCRFLQGPRTNPKEVAKIRKALKAGKSYSGRILNYKKDGTAFWNVLSISPIRDNDGKLIKYIGMQAEASEKDKKPNEEKAKLPEVITETPKQIPISKPSDFSKPPKPARVVEASKTAAFVPELSLPPSKGAIDDLPRMSYRYSMAKSRESDDSAADWHALARLRAEIVSSARSLEAPAANTEKMKNDKSVRRSKGVAQLFRKLNSKISERLRTPEIEYVDCDSDGKALSTVDESEFERRRRSSVYSRSSMDFRLATPSDFGKLEIPERGERLSSAHCEPAAVTVGGRSQFVIIH
uniref:Putative LOV domain-containing protein n=1 Tax=Ricciocarpos natans TaxID=53035 RepID=A0A126X392_RICNA|nr:putative LOV domain-containing protein [Ricciocarpos natans]